MEFRCLCHERMLGRPSAQISRLRVVSKVQHSFEIQGIYPIDISVYFCLLSLILTMIIWRYKTWWCKTFWRRSKPAIASTKTPITILYMRLMCFKPPIILLTPLVLWYVLEFFSFGLLIFIPGYIICILWLFLELVIKFGNIRYICLGYYTRLWAYRNYK